LLTKRRCPCQPSPCWLFAKIVKIFDIHGRLRRLPGSTELEKEVVERSLKYLDSLANEASSDRSLRLELAEA
jgi:hypothetical protein